MISLSAALGLSRWRSIDVAFDLDTFSFLEFAHVLGCSCCYANGINSSITELVLCSRQGWLMVKL